MAGLLIEIILRKPLPTFLCSGRPLGFLSMLPLWAFPEGTRRHGSRAGSKVSSIFFTHSALPLQRPSHSVIISYNWMVCCIYNDPTWTTLGSSHEVLVKSMGQMVLLLTYGKGYRGNNLPSFPDTVTDLLTYPLTTRCHRSYKGRWTLWLHVWAFFYWCSEVKQREKKNPS